MAELDIDKSELARRARVTPSAIGQLLAQLDGPPRTTKIKPQIHAALGWPAPPPLEGALTQAVDEISAYITEGIGDLSEENRALVAAMIRGLRKSSENK
jgi:hypothetical protein